MVILVNGIVVQDILFNQVGPSLFRRIEKEGIKFRILYGTVFVEKVDLLRSDSVLDPVDAVNDRILKDGVILKAVTVKQKPNGVIHRPLFQFLVCIDLAEFHPGGKVRVTFQFIIIVPVNPTLSGKPRPYVLKPERAALAEVVTVDKNLDIDGAVIVIAERIGFHLTDGEVRSAFVLDSLYLRHINKVIILDDIS